MCVLSCVFMWLTMYMCVSLVYHYYVRFLWLTYSVHVCIIMCVYVANSVHVCIISVLLRAFSLANIHCTCVYYYVFSVVNIQCTCVFYVANNVTCTVRVYYQLCVYVVNIHCTCVYTMCI